MKRDDNLKSILKSRTPKDVNKTTINTALDTSKLSKKSKVFVPKREYEMSLTSSIPPPPGLAKQDYSFFGM